MHLNDANTTEIDPDTPHPVVIDMPEHNPGQMGGTMRLGKRTTIFHGDSILSTTTTTVCQYCCWLTLIFCSRKTLQQC